MIGRLVGRLLGRDGALVDVRRRLDGRVLQHLALGGGVQQVGVDRERRLAALVLGDRDLVLLGERDQLLAALELPLAPRRDDLDGRLERVIASARSAPGRCPCRWRRGTRHRRRWRARCRSASWRSAAARSRCRAGRCPLEGVGAEHREHVVAHELLAQILDRRHCRRSPPGCVDRPPGSRLRPCRQDRRRRRRPW